MEFNLIKYVSEGLCEYLFSRSADQIWIAASTDIKTNPGSLGGTVPPDPRSNTAVSEVIGVMKELRLRVLTDLTNALKDASRDRFKLIRHLLFLESLFGGEILIVDPADLQFHHVLQSQLIPALIEILRIERDYTVRYYVASVLANIGLSINKPVLILRQMCNDSADENTTHNHHPTSALHPSRSPNGTDSNVNSELSAQFRAAGLQIAGTPTLVFTESGDLAEFLIDNVLCARDERTLGSREISENLASKIASILRAQQQQQQPTHSPMIAPLSSPQYRAEKVRSILEHIDSSPWYSHSATALRVLAPKGDPVIVDTLLRILQSEVRCNRMMAIEAITHAASTGDQRVVHSLLDIFSQEVWVIRDKAANALLSVAQRGDSVTIQVMLSAFRSGDVRLSAKAMTILGYVAEPDDQQVMNAITEALRSPKFDVRSAAVMALGRLSSDHSTAVPRVCQMLREDENASVKKTAIEVLTSVVDQAELRSFAVSAISGCLGHTDPTVRLSACAGLARLFSTGENLTPDIANSMMALRLLELAKTDAQLIVRKAAARSLAELLVVRCISRDPSWSSIVNHLIEGIVAPGSTVSARAFLFSCLTRFIRRMRAIMGVRSWNLNLEHITRLKNHDSLETHFLLLEASALA